MALKLGTETGSLVNHLLSGTNGQPAPAVGMGVTVLHWSDRNPGTITRVSDSGKTFWFKGDIAKRLDDFGMSESQSYEYTPNPDGAEIKATLRKNGAWKTSGGHQIRLGSREKYYDYSF